MLLVGAVGVLISYVRPSTPATPPVEQNTSQTLITEVGKAPEGLAIEALGKLAIKGRAPKTDYSRDQFGKGWADAGNCDMRNRILARDMTEVRTVSDRDCTVTSGILDDPYTAQKITFTRGQDTSDDVQIDHVVALSDAWQKGAQQLAPAVRQQFANDPLNLLAVDGKTNMAKGDADAATWLPPNRDYRCRYVARQIAVKLKYSLWVTQAEHKAMSGILAACNGQVLPVVTSVP
jgi:hypothetical protein